MLHGGRQARHPHDHALEPAPGRRQRLGVEAALRGQALHLLVRCAWTYLALTVLIHSGFSAKIYVPEPDKSKRMVGFGRVVGLEIEAPHTFGNPV